MQTKFNYAIQWAYDMHTYCELDWGEGGGILWSRTGALLLVVVVLCSGTGR